MSQPSSKQFTIREQGGQYCVYSKDLSKKLGCHPTREEAEAQLRAIEANKHRNASISREEMAAMCPDCALQMQALGLTEVTISQFDNEQIAKIASSAYHRKAAMSPNALEGLIDRVGRTDEGFRTRCMALMEGKVDDTGAFCNWLKQQMLQATEAAEGDTCPMGMDCPKKDGMTSCPKGEDCPMEKAVGKKEAFEADFDEDGPSRTYLKALYDSLSKNVTKEAFFEAMKRARARAGGLMRSRKQKAADKPDTATPPPEASNNQDGASGSPEPGTADMVFSGVSRASMRLQQMPWPYVYSSVARPGGNTPGASPPATASYTQSGTPGKSSAQDDPASGRTTSTANSDVDPASLFPNTLHANDSTTDDLYGLAASEPKGEQNSRGEYGLFMPVAFAEQDGEQSWIPYLPVPGEYESPKYGTILITPARNNNFVKNFKAGIYQRSLPIDAEHDLKVSGALGHIEDMRRNSDGSVDAYVRWTDRGREMVKADRFRYVSPEWYDEWEDPMSRRRYHDVAIGGALTTRPFFKERALRPLVASEKELDAWLGEEIDPIRFTRKEKKMSVIQKFLEMLGPDVKEEDVKAELKQFVAAEPARPPIDAKQAVERMVAAEKRLQAAEERAEIAETRERESNARLLALERESKRKRFFDIVMGRTKESPNRWFGEETKNVEKLVQLADKLGEDSKEFQEILMDRIASANQIHQMLASEHGSRIGIVEGGVEERVEQAAKELREHNPHEFPTLEKARFEVWKRNPEWKKEYREQQSRR